MSISSKWSYRFTLEQIFKGENMGDKLKGCLKCGFPISMRPNLYSEGGVCGACINAEIKKQINWQERQEWLTNHLQQAKNDSGGGDYKSYDCVVGVSGGKDSHMIVKRLVQNHSVKNPLLITTYDECTRTQAGEHNIKNIAEFFNCDHIVFRYKP